MNVKTVLVIFVLSLLVVPMHAIEFGTNIASIQDVKKDGAEVKYAVYWVGAWTDKYGWWEFENALESAKRENVTPIIIWFYWGDQISPENVKSENVYDPIHDVTKSRTRWYSMANELADITKRHMGERPVIIVVENEFNKNGIENYPEFNDDLITQGNIFRSKLNADLVVGFGDWYHQGWFNFRKTVDNYDMVGFQMMRGSTRNSLSEYSSASDSISFTTNFIKTNFNKPSIVFDVALSSYPDYEDIQKDSLAKIFSKVDSYSDSGLKIITYREIVDNKYMSEDEYFGKAERQWGLVRLDGSKKPSYQVFVDGTKSVSAKAVSVENVVETKVSDIKLPKRVQEFKILWPWNLFISF